MLGKLGPAWYTDPDAFRRENERIFSRLWIFAGLASLVAKPDGFFRRRIAGREIVVQNFDGAIRAYDNVCRHRGAILQMPEFGRGPLVCGYHGWRYAPDGSVETIPFEQDCYRLAPALRAGLRLREYPLERVGELLFVNLDPSPRPIEAQFTPSLIESLRSASSSFDREVLFTKYRGRFNWKLAYENLRDSLHPRFVHTRSLNLEVRFEADPGRGDDLGAEPSLPELSFGGPEGTFLQNMGRPFHREVERWGAHDAYFNWLLYPNTHVVSPDGGFSFSIEHHTPIAAHETEVSIYYLTARKKRAYAGSAAVLWAYAQGAKRILDEDTAIMERTQSGWEGGATSTIQGTFEWRNRRTDAWYLRAMTE